VASFIQVGAQLINLDLVVHVHLTREEAGELHLSFHMINGQALGTKDPSLVQDVFQRLGMAAPPVGP
jgi:hypothetical protein